MNLILVMAFHSPHMIVVNDDPAMKVNFYLFDKRPFKSKSTNLAQNKPLEWDHVSFCQSNIFIGGCTNTHTLTRTGE